MKGETRAIKVDGEKIFGFIAAEDGEDYYIDPANCTVRFDSLEEGDRVEFEVKRLALVTTDRGGQPTKGGSSAGGKKDLVTFLENGGAIETAQYMAGHADPRTTKLYDRRR